MPFQANHSVYYPRGTVNGGELASSYAWRTISESKIVERLKDNKFEDPDKTLDSMCDDPGHIVKIKNVWYRYAK